MVAIEYHLPLTVLLPSETISALDSCYSFYTVYCNSHSIAEDCNVRGFTVIISFPFHINPNDVGVITPTKT